MIDPVRKLVMSLWSRGVKLTVCAGKLQCRAPAGRCSHRVGKADANLSMRHSSKRCSTRMRVFFRRECVARQHRLEYQITLLGTDAGIVISSGKGLHHE